MYSDMYERTGQGYGYRQDSSLPVGVHRGKLAGLSEEERHRAMREYKNRHRSSCEGDAYGELKYAYSIPVGVHRVSSVPSGGLVDLLSKQTKDVSVRLLTSMGVKGAAALRKQQVIERVASEIDRLSQAIEQRLVQCEDAEYAGFRLLLNKPGRTFTFAPDDTVRIKDFKPLEPFTWLFYCDDTYHALMPEEVRVAALAIDFRNIDRMRNRRWQLPRAIAVLKEFCGVVPVAEIVPCCKELFGFAPSMEEILHELQGASHRASRYTYYQPDSACWPHATPSETGYVLDVSLAAFRVKCIAEERLKWHAEIPYVAHMPWADAEPPAQDIEAYCTAEFAARDAYVRELLGMRRHGLLKKRGPIDKALARMDVYQWERSLPEAKAVRAWLDGHVPNGKNDYEYADSLVMRLIGSREDSPSPCNLVAVARRCGLFSHTFDSQELLELLVALEGALPSWHLNGWTPRAYHEVCLAEAACKARVASSEGEEGVAAAREPVLATRAA